MKEQDRSISTIHTIIGTLRDGEKGFREVGAKMQLPQHCLFYLEESHVRATFAAELERAFVSLTGVPVHESGTLLGSLHRLYADLRAALATSDYTRLDTTELCERVIVRFYNRALEDKVMPDRFRGILGYQAVHIRRAYDLIVEFRVQAEADMRSQRSPNGKMTRRNVLLPR